MIISDPMHVAALLSKKYPRPVAIPNVVSNLLYTALFEDLNRLLQDPDHKKWALGMQEDDGLWRRDPTPKNRTRDPKWIFHFKDRHHLHNLIKTAGIDISAYREFLEHIEYVLDQAKFQAESYITALDELIPGYALLRNFQVATHTLRLLMDDPPAVSGRMTVATKHQDFSFCTIHLWESRPGFLYWNEEHEKWIKCKEEPLIFLGKKAPLMTGGKRKIDPRGIHSKEIEHNTGMLHALTHKVCEVGSRQKLIEPRLAVVAFCHTPLVL